MSGGGGHGKRKKHEEHEEHENHERWLVSYSDMMTLLMVLFLVLFAMSNVDQTKVILLQEGFNQAFGTNTVLQGSSSVLQSSSSDSAGLDMAAGSGPAGQLTEEEKALVKKAVAAADLAAAQTRMLAAEAEAENLTEAQQKITAALKQQGLAGDASFTIDERGLVVTIITNAVIFTGDSAVLRPVGQRILHAVGPTLKALPNSIEVDGHTNQLPVPTRNYPSAWELSTARASAVVRYLTGNEGIAANRLRAVGFAGTKPLISPSDPRSVRQNRRVEIVVLSDLPDDTSSLLPAAAKSVSASSTATATPTPTASETAEPAETEEGATPSATTSDHSTETDSHD
ncbi:flagellar motor protein MotB [Cryptosporangium aurantiacum]|uniref:Chemotaxis protein MotB n=1 Tax=Cryptosporangium aurantiacum TaxID=134849 RepID=A0A1M7R7A1_9ACTN|nr:flagellar motor protein MotB [Cryptosporangium aurantiacum]SHN42050.1 chemotaxis protein MotB [Cryptosporangium aurantiacum]